ncbi:MAG: kinC [Clostridiales bacterium]|jgi:diguanylate cyclase (GGDEF)-like protein|nr:kinC [Clostridiales bacterium]
MNGLQIKVRQNKVFYLFGQIIILLIALTIYFFEFSVRGLFFLPIGFGILYLVLNYLIIKKNNKDKMLITVTLIAGYGLIISSILLTGGIQSIFIYNLPIGIMLFSFWFERKFTIYCILFNIVFLIGLWVGDIYTLKNFYYILPVIMIMGCELLIFFIQEEKLKFFYEEEVIYHKDLITGLHNYRYFQKFLEGKIKEAQKNNFKFAIFLLDVANLQRINELVGYSAANQLLARIATILQNKKCFEQICFYNGGCFIAFEKVNSIKCATQKAKDVEHLIVGYPLLNTDSLSTNVQINVGWSVYPFQGSSMGQLEVKANEKLNEAKKLKRQEEFEHKNRIEKLTLIGQLAAGFAHEIKNPLTTVKGFCQLEKERPDGKSNADYMQVAIEELERVNNLLSDFLKLAKTHEPKLEKINVEEFLHNVEKIIIPQIRLYDIDFSVKVAPGTPEIFVDKEQMTQVFLNLIINAIDAVKGKKGEISIDSYPTSNGQVTIEVSDNGTGIEEEKLNKIFEPFYSDKEQGTGLGLAISHKIVEAHGGNITVRCIKENGTTFSLFLPANDKKDNIFNNCS